MSQDNSPANDQTLPSLRPYFIRAIFDWAHEAGLTPHLLVATNQPRVQVPAAYIQNNQIVLNITPKAVRDLDLGNDYISFRTRFNGQDTQIFVPTRCVLAIYAQENGIGMNFGEVEPLEAAPTQENTPAVSADTPAKTEPKKASDKKAGFRVVK